MQFLMGLNDEYKPARGQILLMQPLPSIEDAYCMVEQEEKQTNNNSVISMDINTTAMYTNTENQQKNWSRNGNGKNTQDHVLRNQVEIGKHLDGL
ncbi:hypothetical protein BUALT_Bualt11G0064500 [Buddleja alternifolia]|uniref:Retrovirus-related Pol polyprotein from transposon TNT 1-94 n=1 Tax=Buddleja alternifolia TaxID=168488 RepID=A0AAV6X1G6_9LAMI|nr:hypothetical protein BUALT_Bualt11G0064500 [Buddleja alternifolia]